VPWASGPHQLKIDSGFIGFGPMHVSIDGKPISDTP
jgi:hypothetical protein